MRSKAMQTSSVTAVRTLFRVAVGGIFAAHGGQKTFGWFGGEGFGGAVAEMEHFGLRPARPMAAAACAGELGGAVLMMLGLAQPVACTLGCSTMLTAIWSACVPNGFFSRDGGYEYPALLAGSTILLAAEGPGPLSVDRILGIERSGARVAAGCALAATVGSAAVYLIGRGAPADAARGGAPTAEGDATLDGVPVDAVR
jgi:putative oxidoreductase